MSDAIQRLIEPNGGLLDSLLSEHRATCDDRAKCPTEAWVADSRAAVVQLLADKKRQAEHRRKGGVLGVKTRVRLWKRRMLPGPRANRAMGEHLEGPSCRKFGCKPCSQQKQS